MMIKRWMTVLCALCLLVTLAPAALAVDPWDTSGVSGSYDLQMMFAKLQLELAEQAKQSALAQMDGIAERQAEQKKASGYLVRLRELQAAERAGSSSPLPSDLCAFMDKNGIGYGSAGKPNYAMAISGMEAYIERLAIDIQEEMVYIQDYMGQYNSYIQGANTSISGSFQTLTSVTRGGSLFSTGGTVSAQLPPIALSALAGMALGMLLMRAIGRRTGKGDRI